MKLKVNIKQLKSMFETSLLILTFKLIYIKFNYNYLNCKNSFKQIYKL